MITTHNLQQGTAAWHAFRAEHFGASEASAMLGMSPYKTRTQLLNEKKTGLTADVDAFTQKIFDKGHAVEALARPIVEKMIGEDLSAMTYSNGKLSASCDGINFEGNIAWENKQFNATHYEMVKNGELPEIHWPQCQQVLYCTGAEKLFFTVSDGTEERTAGVWVYPEALSAIIVDGWAQFEKDLAVHEVAEAKFENIEAKAIKSLPAVVIQVSGELTNCNLESVIPKFDAFLTKAEEEKENIDIKNGTAIAKFSRDAAIDCKITAKAVVSQMATVSDAVNTLELYAKKFDAMGLVYEKEVDRLKEIEKVAALNKAKSEYLEHIAVLQYELLPINLIVPVVDFALAIKGLKTVESKNNALNVALANAKIEADTVFKDVRCRMDWFNVSAKGYEFLFPDLQKLIYI